MLRIFGIGFACGILASHAQVAPVANGSFEAPVTTFVDLRIDYWQKFPKPAGFPVTDEQWEQSVGLFKNSAPTAADHIDNIDGEQAVFIFNAPGGGIFQDYDSVDYAARTHSLDAVFQVGSRYYAAADFIGGGGNMPEGVQIALQLFYRDAVGQFVPVATTVVSHSTQVFESTTHFVEFQTAAPIVKAGDAWAGKRIGVAIVSMGPFDKPGGYWDVDNVRVGAGDPIFKLDIRRVGSEAHIRWPSAPGYQYQLRSSADLTTWSNVDDAASGTGAPLSKVVTPTTATFFSVLATPLP